MELLFSGKTGTLNEKQQQILEDMKANEKRLKTFIADFLALNSAGYSAIANPSPAWRRAAVHGAVPVFASIRVSGTFRFRAVPVCAACSTTPTPSAR